MEVLFVAFATQYGIASEIRVEANFGAQISGKFSVSHYKCIDSSAALNELNALLAVGYIVILCSIAELSLRARSCMTFGSDTPGITHVILVLFFDLVVLVVMPLVFLSFTAYQDHTSDREGLRIQETLASIPWASTTVSWKRKVNGFFSGLDTFRDLARDRSMLNSTGLVLSILLLLRVIVSSRAHPRVGVLVNTILGTGSDMAHLLLLVSVMFVGFSLIGYAHFGGKESIFAHAEMFNTLWSVFLSGTGNVELSGSALRVIFLLLFALISFTLTFNIVIASASSLSPSP